MAAKSTKGRKNSKSRPKKGQQNTELRGEIIILAVLAVCILLVLSNFGVGGIVGEAVSSVFFGCCFCLSRQSWNLYSILIPRELRCFLTIKRPVSTGMREDLQEAA